MKILRVNDSDLSEILNLQRLAYHENAERYNDFKIPPLTQTLEELREEAESSVILKAVHEAKIVGSVRAIKKGNNCYIGKLIVHPEHQNKGIGRILIAKIEKIFEGSRYELFTGHLDEKNLSFYEKLDYKRFKEKKINETLRFVYFEKGRNIIMKYVWLDEYCLSKKGVEKEYKLEWDATRYMINGKMFALQGGDKEGKPIITVKLNPIHSELLRSQYKDIIPGYYMNKEHWSSMYLEGEVPDQVLKKMLDEGYSLIFESLNKKLQKQILG